MLTCDAVGVRLEKNLQTDLSFNRTCRSSRAVRVNTVSLCALWLSFPSPADGDQMRL